MPQNYPDDSDDASGIVSVGSESLSSEGQIRRVSSSDQSITENNYPADEEIYDNINYTEDYQDESVQYSESSISTDFEFDSNSPIRRNQLKRPHNFENSDDRPKYPRLDYSESEFLSSEIGHAKLQEPDCSQNYLSASRSVDRHRNYFHGNQNYYRFFNKETKDFMNFTTDNNYPPLIGTYIQLSRRKIIPRMMGKYNGDLCDGSSFWSSKEKNLFFELLARYSIHRVDIIKAKLPNKSVFEILNYYELLKSETKKWKNKKKYKLVSMNEMPRSYEMSEEFILFEESQALELQRISTRRMDKNIFDSRRKYSSPDSKYDDLINLKELENIKDTIFPDDRTRMLPPIQKLLTELTASYTKELLMLLIKSRGNKQGFQFALRISGKEIIQATEKLQKRKKRILFSEIIDPENFNPVDGNTTLKRPTQRRIAERLLTREMLPQLQDYEQANIDTSIFGDIQNQAHCQDVDNEEEEANGEHYNENATDGLIDEMTPFDVAIDHPLSIDTLESFKTDKEDAPLGDERDHVFRNPNDSLYSQFSYNQENESAMKTFLMETSMLNLLDHEASLKYEHILLNYMTSDSELVRFNDLDICRYYVLNSYYPEVLGIGTSDDSQDASNALVGVRRTSDNYQGLYFNEDNPFTVPDFDDVSNEMVLDMSYNYSFY